MGRTQPSFAMQIQNEQEAFLPMRRALRKADQAIFDELFVAANFHRACAQLATRALPMEAMLLSMLIEEHKMVKHLQVEIEALQNQKTGIK